MKNQIIFTIGLLCLVSSVASQDCCEWSYTESVNSVGICRHYGGKCYTTKWGCTGGEKPYDLEWGCWDVDNAYDCDTITNMEDPFCPLTCECAFDLADCKSIDESGTVDDAWCQSNCLSPGSIHDVHAACMQAYTYEQKCDCGCGNYLEDGYIEYATAPDSDQNAETTCCDWTFTEAINSAGICRHKDGWLFTTQWGCTGGEEPSVWADEYGCWDSKNAVQGSSSNDVDDSCPEDSCYFELEECVTISDSADDAWCQANCLSPGSINEIHAACHPDTVSGLTCDCGCAHTWEQYPSNSIEVCLSASDDSSDLTVSDETVIESTSQEGEVDDCPEITLWDECNYEGTSMTVAEASECLDFVPKSLCLPEGGQITLFNVCGFAGQSATFSQDEPCLDDDSYNLLERNVVFQGKKSALKKNSKTERVTYEVKV